MRFVSGTARENRGTSAGLSPTRENRFSRAGDISPPVPLFFHAVPRTDRMETKGGGVHENIYPVLVRWHSFSGGCYVCH
jgi:hypothetical protein